MRTSKPISTISYNSGAWLKGALKELLNAGLIEFYAYIHHNPEDDEAGLKEHFHLWIVPAKQLQTEELRDFFKEPDSDTKLPPRGVLPFHSSKHFDDWGLYSVHDAGYLATKHQSRKFSYEWKDFETSDKDELNRYIYEIDYSKFSVYQNMEMAFNSGFTFNDFLREFKVPIQQIGGYVAAWKLITSEHTERAGREGHDEVDPANPWELFDIYGWHIREKDPKARANIQFLL